MASDEFEKETLEILSKLSFSHIREIMTKDDFSHRTLRSALFERSMMNGPKLSTVVRQIAPKAEQVFRDQYVLEFLGGQKYEHENSMKKALISQKKRFVLEVGKDFLFMDEEYRIQVGNSDFRIDLLFYHRELQCLVAFELKMGKFKPEHLGQLNFYL